MKWLILVLGIASNASASVLVKMAMMPPRKFPSLSDPMAALSNWPFWLGLVTLWWGIPALRCRACPFAAQCGAPGPYLRGGGDRCPVFGIPFQRTISLDNRCWHLAGYCRRGTHHGPREPEQSNDMNSISRYFSRSSRHLASPSLQDASLAWAGSIRGAW